MPGIVRLLTYRHAAVPDDHGCTSTSWPFVSQLKTLRTIFESLGASLGLPKALPLTG